MKAATEQKQAGFQPVTVTITLETADEVRVWYEVMGAEVSVGSAAFKAAEKAYLHPHWCQMARVIWLQIKMFHAQL